MKKLIASQNFCSTLILFVALSAQAQSQGGGAELGQAGAAGSAATTTTATTETETFYKQLEQAWKTESRGEAVHADLMKGWWLGECAEIKEKSKAFSGLLVIREYEKKNKETYHRPVLLQYKQLLPGVPVIDPNMKQTIMRMVNKLDLYGPEKQKDGTLGYEFWTRDLLSKGLQYYVRKVPNDSVSKNFAGKYIVRAETPSGGVGIYRGWVMGSGRAVMYCTFGENGFIGMP